MPYPQPYHHRSRHPRVSPPSLSLRRLYPRRRRPLSPSSNPTTTTATRRQPQPLSNPPRAPPIQIFPGPGEAHNSLTAYTCGCVGTLTRQQQQQQQMGVHNTPSAATDTGTCLRADQRATMMMRHQDEASAAFGQVALDYLALVELDKDVRGVERRVGRELLILAGRTHTQERWWLEKHDDDKEKRREAAAAVARSREMVKALRLGHAKTEGTHA